MSADNIPEIFTDGKEWRWTETGTLLHPEDEVYTVKVCGDTIVEDKVCRKLLVSYDNTEKKSFSLAVYEENGKVYGYNFDYPGFSLIMDFNLHKGDTYTYTDFTGQTTTTTVTDEDWIENDSGKYRRLTIDGRCHWVEGVGCDSDMALLIPIPSHCGIVQYMDACYENGKEIFTKDDFKKQATNINAVESGIYRNDRIYDINGMVVKGMKIDGIFIKNGKKYIR